MPDAKKSSPRRRMKWTIAIGAVCALLALGFWWFSGKKVWTDGLSIRVAQSDAKLREVLWTPPESLAPELNASEQQYEPSISPDGTELFFVRGKPGKNADIYVSYRRDNAWAPPTPLEVVNSAADDLGPRVSGDGQVLYFYSDRAGGLGGYDIWAAPRDRSAKGGWGKPFNLGPSVNSEFNEFSPDPTPDGRRLLFATNRKAARREQATAWRATIRQSDQGDYDLWTAELDTPATAQIASTPRAAAPLAPAPLASAQLASTQPAPTAAQLATTQSATTQPVASTAPPSFKSATELQGINTPFAEGASCMSPAGDFLYFASNRPGGYGKFDLYRCRFNDGVCGAIENLGPSVNTSENETDPALGLGGYRIYFSSDRNSNHGAYALFTSDSREVFPSRDAHALPHLGWSWLVLLVSALLLAPLLYFLRGWDDRRLNVLQKCLLLSVLIHLLVTFALSFVVVTQQAVHYVKKEMGLEIAVNLNAPQGVEVGLAIRSQSSSDLPVSVAAPPSLGQSVAAAEPITLSGPVVQELTQGPVRPGQMTVQIAIAAPSLPAASHLEASLPTPAIPGAAMPDVQMSLPKGLSQPEAQMHAEMPPTEIARAAAGMVAISGPKISDAPTVTAATPQAAAVTLGVANARPTAPTVLPSIAAEPAAAAGAEFAPGPNLALPRGVGVKIAVASAAPAAGEAAPSLSQQASNVSLANSGPALPELGRGGGAAPTALPAPSGNAIAAPAVAPHLPSAGRGTPDGAPTEFALAPSITLPASHALAPAAGRLDAPATTEPSISMDRQIAAAAAGGGTSHGIGNFPTTAPSAAPDGKSAIAGVSAAPASATAVAAGLLRSSAAPTTGPAFADAPAAAPQLAAAAPAGARQSAHEPSLASLATPETTGPATQPAAAFGGVASAGMTAQLGSPSAAPSEPTAQPVTLGRGLPTGSARIAVEATPASPALPGQVAVDAPPGIIGTVKIGSTRLSGTPGSEQPRVAEAAVASDRQAAGPALGGAAQSTQATAPAAVAARDSTIASAAPAGPRLAMAHEITGGTPFAMPAVDGPSPSMPAIRGKGTGSGVQGGIADRPAGPEAVPFAAGRSLVAYASNSAIPAGFEVEAAPASAGLPGKGIGKIAGPLIGRPNGIDTGPAAVEARITIQPIQGALGPGKFTAPDSPFMRAPEQRKPLVEKLGGTEQSESAVDRALAWLARNQEPNGRWTRIDDDGPPGKRPQNVHDAAFTGLAMLAFLAQDHVPTKPGPYRDVVTGGLDYLLSIQGADGDMRGLPQFRGPGSSRADMYDHGIATLALAEAALMTHDQRYTDAALNAAKFTVAAQDPRGGGWRYLPREPGDTSVFGWQVMALHAAEQLGFEIPASTREAAFRYIASCGQRKHKMVAGYQPGSAPSPAMTAELLYCRMLLGQHIDDAAFTEATAFLAGQPPEAGNADLYCWYYASLSMMQMQNDQWKDWNARTRDALVKMQQKSGKVDGCWAHDQKWGGHGGRVFSTAMATLTLEVYYRYLPLRDANGEAKKD